MGDMADFALAEVDDVAELGDPCEGCGLPESSCRCLGGPTLARHQPAPTPRTSPDGLTCPECGAPMGRHSGQYGYWWQCGRGCDVKCSEHPDGTLKSTPAGAELRRLRKHAHQLAGRIWDWSDKEQRRAMYAWLAAHTRAGHIGYMEADECLDTIAKLEELLRDLERFAVHEPD